MRGPAVVLLLCGAVEVLAAPSVKLAEAKRLIEDLELEKALKSLDAAEAIAGNSKDTLVEIASLRGATLATLGKTRPAEEAFRLALFLDPAFKLVGDYPPRVRTPFYAARDWAAKNGTLEASAEAAQLQGQIETITIVVNADALKLASKVRFYVRTGSSWAVDDVAVASGRAKRVVGQPSVEWWAELLSPKAAVLMTFASDVSPRIDTAPLVNEPVGKRADEQLSGRLTPALRPMRLVSISLMGAGVVAAAVGIGLGVNSVAARSQFLDAAKDATGLVTGLSRVDALALEERSKREATIANVLFVSSVVVAVTGAVLFLVDLTKTTVALMPSPGAVWVVGRF
jgi:hypothetical protein